MKVPQRFYMEQLSMPLERFSRMDSIHSFDAFCCPSSLGYVEAGLQPGLHAATVYDYNMHSQEVKE